MRANQGHEVFIWTAVCGLSWHPVRAGRSGDSEAGHAGVNLSTRYLSGSAQCCGDTRTTGEAEGYF